MIVMSEDGVAAAGTARALAAALDWRRAEARDPHALHATAAAVLGRREHLIVASRALSAAEQAVIRGDLRNVRFVDVAAEPADMDARVHAIRNDFGL